MIHEHGSPTDTQNTNSVHESGPRTALEEMLLRCDSEKWALSRTEDTLREILRGGELAVGDFFLALSNPRPIPLVKALLNGRLYNHSPLRVPVMNSDIIYYYSPTMYISRGLSFGPDAQRERLLGTLQSWGFKDEFYARQDQWQPEDAVGLPLEIQNQQRLLIADLEGTQHNRRVNLYNFQNHRMAEAKSNNKKKKEIKALQTTEETEKRDLEFKFRQEDNQRKQNHVEAQAQLQQNAARRKQNLEIFYTLPFSPSMVGGNEDGDGNTGFRDSLVQDNWRIQQGNVEDKKRQHWEGLVGRREILISEGVARCSEMARVIAGWQ